MTRKEAAFWMLGGGMLFVGLAVSGTAQQAKPEPKKQEALNKALIRAVRAHDVKTVRALLAQGADANAQDRDAKPDDTGALLLPADRHPPTVLMTAFDDVVLSSKGAHSDLKTKRFADPADIVKALLEKGSDPNVLGYAGKPILLIAVEHQYTASVRLLLEHGAPVNRAWVHGITPLHFAARAKDLPTVKLLLAKGADRKAQSAFDDLAHPLDEQVRILLQQAKEPKGNR